MRTFLTLYFLWLGSTAFAADPLVGFTEHTVGWVETKRIPAPEANQAAAADKEHFYAVTNEKIAKYDRSSGKQVATSTGAAKHLNSAFLHEGNLLCAHSNYPTVPEQSEIKLLDTKTMQLTTFHDFGNFGGSLTWCVLRENHWWCNFAKYGDKNAETFLVKFDRDWKEIGRWTYPASVIKELHRMSLSGGIWNQHQLLVTGHDDGVFFVLDLPEKGMVLEHVRTVKMPFTGQGFAYDSWTNELIGIDRKRRELVLAELDPSQSVRLRVMSYNIHHGEGTDGKIDLDRIARVINSVEPDLVGLQEVDSKVPRSNNVIQAYVLGELTGKIPYFTSSIPLNGGNYGNAILSKGWIISKSNSQELPNHNNGELRRVQKIEISFPKRRKPLFFLNTHLDHRPHEYTRWMSTQAIDEWVKDEYADMILVGDFNAESESKSQQVLRRTWTRTNMEPLSTIPVEKPAKQIDYIYVKPANRFRIIKTEVLPEAVASDHRAIWAEVELLPEVSNQENPGMK